MKQLKMLKNDFLKRFLSITLAFLMILGGLPMEGLVAFANDGTLKINSVLITKIFTDTYGAESYLITIAGTNFIKDNLNQVEVGIMGGDGRIKSFKPTYSTPNLVQYEVAASQISGNLYINGEGVDISDDGMPSITTRQPSSGIIDSIGEAKITLNGSGFSKLSTSLKAYLFQGNTEIGIPKETTDIPDNTISSTELKGKTGIWGVLFRNSTKKDLNGQVEVPLVIEHRYVDMFVVINDLDVSNTIELIPTQGRVESQVTLKADSLKPENEMSVFFLDSLDDQYTVERLATDENYRRDTKENKDIFTMRVPKGLSPGSYFVVLTNNINPTKSVKEQIKSYKVVSDKFTVIDRKNSVVLDSITPNSGPGRGIDAEVKGINIGRISSAIYENGTMGDPDITTNPNKMIIEYTGGRYHLIGTNGINVETLTREITILVGGPVRFRENSDLSKDTYDYLSVRVEENTDNQNLVKDVIAQIETTIVYKENDITKTAKIVETDTLVRGFTYEPLDYLPKITNIVPDRIPVDDENEILPELKISILGENFLVYRYTTEDGIIKYKYPKVDLGLGSKIVLDPNNDDIEMKVLDKNGKEVDGTNGNELGTKILVTIPGGKFIDENLLNNVLDLKVTNPLRVPDSSDEGSSATGKIVFVRPTDDKKPIIIDVSPSTVTIAGDKGITITGQNFGSKAAVYIDGIKVANPQRNGTGTEIVFDAPPNNEGYVQIIVQNEDGGIGMYNEFLYVNTYTEPKIIDFNPKAGSANTLVTLQGENLLPPNPLVKDLGGIGIYKLIGTRIFLNKQDINSYYMPDGKTINLQKYNSPDNNLIVQTDKDGRLKLADYSHSVILQDDNTGSYYKIYFDIKLGRTLLTDGDKNTYEVFLKDGVYYGKKAGEPETILVPSSENITIDGKTLSIRTPYEIETVDGVNKITGNRVKVINNNELMFNVPPLPREGHYDLRIVNPDTKHDEKIGLAGFYYFFQPGEKPPKIETIDPNQGSTDGQYYIYIKGENFIDRGSDDQKSKVIIGGVVVNPKDVEGSLDGKTLKVRVPKYPGELAKETNMDRKTVPVIVVNPDGGSDSREDGFTYVIPVSHPKITKLILNKGNAAGGELVIIEGSDFRFFEPFSDANNNGRYDIGEHFTDLNIDSKADSNSNGKKKWDDLREKAVLDVLKKDWENSVEPILPKVYFGGERATVKGFTASTIEVETPKGVKGPVEVYLVNNDYGVSNKLTYTYEASAPEITEIKPSSGPKQGRTSIGIYGDDFVESEITYYTSASSTSKKKMQVVQFGSTEDDNISNKDIAIEIPASGRIRDKMATVKLGNLTVSYDASEDVRELNFTIKDNSEEFKLDNVVYDDTEVFIPLNLLKNSNNIAYDGYEYVRIKLEKIPGATSTNRLRVDRGFSPQANLDNKGYIILRTPMYYTTGKVPVTVINPDGGEATGEFEYKNPNSKPKITNILRDGDEGIAESDKIVIKVNYKGSNTITIVGSDFINPVKSIQIGNVVEIKEGIEYNPKGDAIANKLTFKLPAVDEKYIGTEHRVVVENEDGGIAASDDVLPPDIPIYIEFIKGETDGLEITKVTPNIGPTTGGTTVTIEGNDFRSKLDGYPNGELKVYFGDGESQVRVSNEDIISIEFNKIQLKTTPHAPGSVTVKVENPDRNIAELANAFTYLSNPKITVAVDPSDENERLPISKISVLGGVEIKLKGAGFMEGAKVYFAPKVRVAEKDEIGNNGIIYIEGVANILEEGTEGTNYNRIDGETATIITPQGKIESFGVIIVNPDGGASPIYKDITYDLPELSAPSGVVAELVYDRFIRVHWTGVTGATEYEIFVVIDDKTTELIGTTELTSFAYNDLEPTTKYKFIVKAVGNFGSSKGSMESNTVTTGKVVGPPDEDGGLGEETTMSKSGNTANVVIGSNDSGRSDILIDLTRGDLAGSKEVVISLPASIIVDSGNRNIQVIGSDFTLQFKPSAFNVASVRENKSKADAGVRFVIGGDSGNTQVASGNQLSTVYKLEASTYVGKTINSMDHLASSIVFTLDYDSQKANLRRLNVFEFNYFDSLKNSWQPLGFSSNSLGGAISSDISRLGRYTIIGSRR